MSFGHGGLSGLAPRSRQALLVSQQGIPECLLRHLPLPLLEGDVKLVVFQLGSKG